MSIKRFCLFIFLSFVAGCSTTPRSDPYEAKCGSAKGYFFSGKENLPPDFERDYLENAPVDAMECRADAGDYYARYNLGRLYLEGKRVPLDYKKARELFLLAARPEAEPDKLISRSFGPVPDIVVEHKGAGGFPPAQYALGLMHYTEGWAMFVIAFAMLGAVAWLLDRIERRLRPRR